MQLFGYSDNESQGLHLNPFMTARLLVGPGSDETQPLWLSSPIRPRIIDACWPLEVGREAPWWLDFDGDMQRILDVAGQGACDVEVPVNAWRDLELNRQGQLEVSAEILTDIEVVLGLRKQAGVIVELNTDSNVVSEVSAEATCAVLLNDAAVLAVEIKEDGYLELNIEVCGG